MMKINRIKVTKFFAIFSLFAFILQIFSFTVSGQFSARVRSEEKFSGKQFSVRTKRKTSPDTEPEYGVCTDAAQKNFLMLKTNGDLDENDQTTINDRQLGGILLTDLMACQPVTEF